MELIKYQTACTAIAECYQIDEVKDWADKAAALAVYAKQAKNEELIKQCLGIKNRAMIRLGELSRELERAQGERTDLIAPVRTSVQKPKKEVLAQSGISKDSANRAEQLASAPEKIKDALSSGDLTPTEAIRKIKEVKREAKREENRQKIQSFQKDVEIKPLILQAQEIQFSTIVIDPPWDWGDEGDIDQFGRARPDYQTMSINQIMGLPLDKLSLPDSHVYLWITNRSLPKGFALLESWGYRYITCITWVKPSFGMGNYFRGQTEQILFGVKGSLPLKRKDAPTYFMAPRGPGGHSSKPIEFYSFVESCSHSPYLEMFSRHQRDGWSSWGENGVS
jgi:N6-adenosine-specific RNA methylase IME4